MNRQALQNAASLIVKNNVKPNIDSVRVEWVAAMSKLKIEYYVDGEIGDEERELCELSLAELLGEFPEIRAAETECIRAVSRPRAEIGSEAMFVFRRSDAWSAE